MKTRRIVWTTRAQDQLNALYDWIADRADPDTAFSYVSAIETHMAERAVFPDRGTPRPDLSPGVRTTPYRRRTVIAYRVLPDRVEVLALVHGGQMLDNAFEE